MSLVQYLCYSWKFFSIYFSSLKYLHFKRLTVKGLYQKRYQRYVFFLHLLHKAHWHLFSGFISLFMYWKQRTMIQSFLWYCNSQLDFDAVHWRSWSFTCSNQQKNYFQAEICLYHNVVFYIIYYCKNGFNGFFIISISLDFKIWSCVYDL